MKYTGWFIIKILFLIYWLILSHLFCYMDYIQSRIDFILLYKGETINAMCMFYIIRTFKNVKLEKPTVAIGIILFGWFLYYTPLDLVTVNQSIWLSLSYGFIDIVTCIYVFITLKNHFITEFSQQVKKQILLELKNIIKFIVMKGAKWKIS